MGELIPKKSEKEKLALYEEMIRLSSEGIRLDTNAAECYFMRALGNGRKATTKGILDSLFMARSMEQDWLRALDLGIRYVSPTREDSRADTYHALALYYRILPDSILLQWLFKTRGSLAKSLDYSRKAAEISPHQCEMVLEMGVCLVAKGMEEKKADLVNEGKLWLGRVLALSVVKKTDLIDKRHAAMLLAHPEMCRDYERDGQVERDLKKSKNLGAGTAARPMEQ